MSRPKKNIYLICNNKFVVINIKDSKNVTQPKAVLVSGTICHLNGQLIKEVLVSFKMYLSANKVNYVDTG